MLAAELKYFFSAKIFKLPTSGLCCAVYWVSGNSFQN